MMNRIISCIAKNIQESFYNIILVLPPACMVWHLDLPPPSVVRAGVDRVGVVDVMAGVFCGVDGNVEPRVGISHKYI